MERAKASIEQEVSQQSSTLHGITTGDSYILCLGPRHCHDGKERK